MTYDRQQRHDRPPHPTPELDRIKRRRETGSAAKAPKPRYMYRYGFRKRESDQWRWRHYERLGNAKNKSDRDAKEYPGDERTIQRIPIVGRWETVPPT